MVSRVEIVCYKLCDIYKDLKLWRTEDNFMLANCYISFMRLSVYDVVCTPVWLYTWHVP